MEHALKLGISKNITWSEVFFFFLQKMYEWNKIYKNQCGVFCPLKNYFTKKYMDTFLKRDWTNFYSLYTFAFEKFHVGINSAEYLIKLLVKKQEDFMKYIDQNMEMNMTKIDKWRFNKSTHCKSCNKKFDENVVKTRDHDHFTGVENI